MKNTEMKRIITILLVIGLISTQFVFAASEPVGEDNGYVSEVNETETTDFSDEGKSEVVTEPADEDVTVLEDISSRTGDDSNEDESPEGSVIYDETAEGNVYDGREPDDPPLRSLPENYFTDPFDAADYLDEKIVDYLENNGSANIEMFIGNDNSGNNLLLKILFYSKLFKAFCGYKENLDDSFYYDNYYEQINGCIYLKFIFNIESTLTSNQITQACTIANAIASAANQEATFADKINYINDEINNRIDYHDECISLIYNIAPNDFCDTLYSLCTGNAICTGFASAFCLICYEAGLDFMPVTGYIKKSDGSYKIHTWNLIKDGSTWKQVDCTYDMVLFGTDLESTRGLFDCFTSDFEQNHVINTPYAGWIETNAGWSYIDQYGYPKAEGWVVSSNHWYYFDEYACMVTSKWVKDSIDWCYMGNDGRMVTSEWVQDDIGWCYMDSNGHITRSQWLLKNGYWYYLKADGHMAANEWIQDSTDWCYMGTDGRMVTNDWAQDSVGWCYMSSSGHITRSAWIQKNGFWYYLKANGYRAENEWIQDSTDWCYMGTDGRMVTNDWAQDSVGWCYMSNSGHITRSAWIQKNGFWYYLKANGYRAENEWAQDSTGYCWMDSNGRWDSGTKWIGSPFTIGSSYILSGHRVDSQTIAINGYNCTFSGTGELTGFVEIP